MLMIIMQYQRKLSTDIYIVRYFVLCRAWHFPRLWRLITRLQNIEYHGSAVDIWHTVRCSYDSLLSKIRRPTYYHQPMNAKQNDNKIRHLLPRPLCRCSRLAHVSVIATNMYALSAYIHRHSIAPGSKCIFII